MFYLHEYKIPMFCQGHIIVDAYRMEKENDRDLHYKEGKKPNFSLAIIIRKGNFGNFLLWRFREEFFAIFRRAETGDLIIPGGTG